MADALQTIFPPPPLGMTFPFHLSFAFLVLLALMPVLFLFGVINFIALYSVKLRLESRKLRQNRIAYENGEDMYGK
jgi:hypothetical protein